MRVYAKFYDGHIDIVLPHAKVREYIVIMLSREKGISKDDALKEVKKIGQEYYEELYRDEIERYFYNFVRKEVNDWVRYENHLEKRKKK